MSNTIFRRPALPFIHPVTLLVTCGGIGLVAKAPGTFGSLAALIAGWFIVEAVDVSGLAQCLFAVFLLGTWASDAYVRRSGRQDASEIVVDEVAGQWLVLLLVPHTLLGYAIAFILFRLFDIWKPWPISWCDRHIKDGFGVMLDDLVAGLVAWVPILIWNYWALGRLMP